MSRASEIKLASTLGRADERRHFYHPLEIGSMAMAAQTRRASLPAIDAENNAMKWGSLLWLGYLAAGEIGRQPKPPLTEEQKRRRQQYIADKKVKSALGN